MVRNANGTDECVRESSSRRTCCRIYHSPTIHSRVTWDAALYPRDKRFQRVCGNENSGATLFSGTTLANRLLQMPTSQYLLEIFKKCVRVAEKKSSSIKTFHSPVLDLIFLAHTLPCIPRTHSYPTSPLVPPPSARLVLTRSGPLVFLPTHHSYVTMLAARFSRAVRPIPRVGERTFIPYLMLTVNHSFPGRPQQPRALQA